MPLYAPDGFLVLGVVGDPQVLKLTVDPTAGAGVAAPIGTLGPRTNGELYMKTGAANNAWTLQATAATVAANLKSQRVLVNPKYGSQASVITVANNAVRGAFIGYAYRAFVAGEVFPTRWLLQTAAVTITWAELAIGKGPIVMGGNPLITPVGFADISGQVIGAAGGRNTNVAISVGQSIAAGDGLWAIMGSNAVTAPTVDGMQANDSLLSGIQGTNVTAAWRPSLQLGVVGTFTLDVVAAALRTLTIAP